MQQGTSADDIFSCIIFVAGEGLNTDSNGQVPHLPVNAWLAVEHHSHDKDLGYFYQQNLD